MKASHRHEQWDAKVRSVDYSHCATLPPKEATETPEKPKLTWAQMARKEGHKKSHPKGSGPNRGLCPIVSKRRDDIVKLIKAHPGITPVQIRVSFPDEHSDAISNDLGTLRAHSRVHCKGKGQYFPGGDE